MDADPREQYGIIVESVINRPFQLVPSLHTSPDTGGLLDYGISAAVPDGRVVIIGELFAAGIGREGKIRLNTKEIGERVCQILNVHWDGSNQP